MHLGNNAVNVVFIDPNSKLPFDPATIASKFNRKLYILRLAEHSRTFEKSSNIPFLKFESNETFRIHSLWLTGLPFLIEIFLVVSLEAGSDAASRHLACKKPKTVRPSLSLSGSSFRDDTSSTESNSEDISESFDTKSVRSSPGNVFAHRSASQESSIVIPTLSKKNVSNPTLQTRKSHRMKFVEEKDIYYK